MADRKETDANKMLFCLFFLNSGIGVFIGWEEKDKQYKKDKQFLVENWNWEMQSLHIV